MVDEPVVQPLTPEQIATLASAGAGPIADRARMAGAAFALTADEVRNYGAGFVSDLLRMAKVTGPQPYTAVVENIANQNPANISVSSVDFPYFQVGATVGFDGTGNATLDAGTFSITSVNTVGKSFKIDLDLSAAPTPITVGTATTTPLTPPTPIASLEGEIPAEPLKTILTDPQPLPTVLEPLIPDGYREGEA